MRGRQTDLLSENRVRSRLGASFIRESLRDSSIACPRVLRDDYQSPAMLVSLPSILDLAKRNTFGVNVNVSFCGVSHDLPEAFDQNLTRRNAGCSHNCQWSAA